MPVLQALLYLRLMMLRNLLLSFLRRLRQPRYLLGLAIGLGYFWLLFFRKLGRPPATLQDGITDSFQLFNAGLLSVVAMAIWLLPGDKPNLRFTEAEVAFLFPAPLKRRQLIHYKLLTGLVTSLLGSVFFMLVSTRLGGGVAQAVRFLGAWWMLLNLISLHDTGASFTLARLGSSRLVVVLRRAVVAVLMLLFLMLVGYLAVNQQMDSLRMLLAPAHFVLQPFYVTGLAWVQAMAWLVLLFAVHYWWVLRMETPFEEASMAKAASRAEILAQFRAGKSPLIAGKAKARREPFALSPAMPVELVLLWKNLMLARPYLNRRVFAVCALVIAFGLPRLQQSGVAGQSVVGGLAVMALAILAYMVLLGPQIVRMDLRNDLAQADLLKAWPLPGWRIVLGNLLAPVVVMTAIGWLLLLTANIGITVGGKFMPWLTLPLKLAVAGSMALYLPALIALLLLGPNAMALYFPAWSQLGMANQRGFDAMGLRLLMMVGQLLLLAVTLVPVLMVAALVYYLSQWLSSSAVGIVLAAASSLVVLVLEILFAIHLLGERFEQLDIAAELRQ